METYTAEEFASCFRKMSRKPKRFFISKKYLIFHIKSGKVQFSISIKSISLNLKTKSVKILW